MIDSFTKFTHTNEHSPLTKGCTQQDAIFSIRLKSHSNFPLRLIAIISKFHTVYIFNPITTAISSTGLRSQKQPKRDTRNRRYITDLRKAAATKLHTVFFRVNHSTKATLNKSLHEKDLSLPSNRPKVASMVAPEIGSGVCSRNEGPRRESLHRHFCISLELRWCKERFEAFSFTPNKS